LEDHQRDHERVLHSNATPLSFLLDDCREWRDSARPMRTDRRDFLKVSLAGAATLSTVSFGASVSGCSSSSPATGMKHLRSEDIALLSALTPVIMAGKVSPDDEPGIASVVQSFDTLLDDTSPPVVAGVLQAFDLLNLGLTRGLATGQWASWSKASYEDAESALFRLRDSGIGLLNAIYAAVIRLVISAYYLIDENAAATGYRPPVKVAGILPPADTEVAAKEAAQ
jgi:hypothetical protein